jgi:hypothetical protein
MISRPDPDTAGEGGWAGEGLPAPETGRVGGLREAPDGSIRFPSVNDGAVRRTAPDGWRQIDSRANGCEPWAPRSR